jgi:hypothetical protein
MITSWTRSRRRNTYSLWSVFAGVKRGAREVSTEESKQRAAGEDDGSTKQLAEVRAEIGKLAGEGLELADIVGGGDGRGSGMVGQGRVRQWQRDQGEAGLPRDIQTNRLQKVNYVTEDKARRIAWVFVPDGQR